MPDTEYHYAGAYTHEVDRQVCRGDRYSLGKGNNAGGRADNTEAEAREATFAALHAGWMKSSSTLTRPIHPRPFLTVSKV